MNDRVETLFHQASDLPPDGRRALLDAACRDDPGLRAEVERLLAEDARLRAADNPMAFLDSPLVRSPDPKGDLEEEFGGGPEHTWPSRSPGPSGLLPPTPLRIASYRIVRLLAEGGMGAVYEAEQDSPRRPVALKVVRPGFASPALIKRLTHEAQILAGLHHPGIAQVYEAGLADDGQPFFAMEFISGLPLDEYANRRGLDLAARVGLVARVCDAVQHAHLQGVIHRDLKPANILVEETGQPKVLDFGVARATNADLLTAAGLTLTGQLLGTPNYMSPEQVAADPAAIDQRADVYALGIILYELAAHRLPYRLEDRPLAEAARLILEQDPPRLGSLDSELRGDVETIVAKAMEKDPARRYPSASALAEDLRRWLAHEPILARPPSALYHLRKFARRHTGLVGGVVATGVALVLGLVGTILFAVGEARQRGLAEQNARAAMFETYRARLAAAVAALSAHDVADAARQLEAAPQELRDWEWRHLHSRLDDSSAVIRLPQGGRAFLLPALDRFRVGIFTGSSFGLTDLEGGEPSAFPLPAGSFPGGSAIQTRVGLRVAAWSGSKTFRLLDENGRGLCRVDLPWDGGPRSVIVSPDGSRLATYSQLDGWAGVGVFDARSGKPIALCKGHPSDMWSYTLSPDGKHVASGSEDHTARIWDAANGSLVATCLGHTSKVVCVSFSPDGTRLLSASSDGTVCQWAVPTGRMVEPPYDRHSGDVIAAAYSPDGQQIASAGTDRTLRIWNATGRQDLAILHGHTGAVTDVAFDQSGRRLASVSGVARLAVGDGTVRSWEVDPRATLPVLRGHSDYVYPVAFSPDGRWIASGAWDETVCLWDAATGEECASLPQHGMVHDLAYGPDGTWLVSATLADSRLRIWDIATARLRREIEVPSGRLRFVTVRPDGRRLVATTTPLDASAVPVHYLHVCDVADGRLLFSAEGKALAYSPDCRWLAVRDADEKGIVLLDAETHQPAARFPGHEGEVFSASFSSDSRQLASCGFDRTIRVWQIDSGASQVLRGYTDDIFALAFHPDGTRLASAGRDRAIWLWDLERREEVARLQGHTSYVRSLAFSPDGTTLVSGSGDRTVRLWDTAPLKVRYQARREAEVLRPEAERLVERLWNQKNAPAEIVKTLRANPVLSEPLRHAAELAVLRRAIPPKSRTSHSVPIGNR
jgi:WD40 repeat protein/serine/threonine protein kinase